MLSAKGPALVNKNVQQVLRGPLCPTHHDMGQSVRVFHHAFVDLFSHGLGFGQMQKDSAIYTDRMVKVLQLFTTSIETLNQNDH